MDKKYIIPVLVALINIGVFALMFGAMGYFELMGADQSYFDEGTVNNIGYINSALGLLGLKIDPIAPHRITTVMFSVCLGIAFVTSYFAIVIANRKSLTECEVTDLVS